jgi:hypothetical protein
MSVKISSFVLESEMSALHGQTRRPKQGQPPKLRSPRGASSDLRRISRISRVHQLRPPSRSKPKLRPWEINRSSQLATKNRHSPQPLPKRSEMRLGSPRKLSMTSSWKRPRPKMMPSRTSTLAMRTTTCKMTQRRSLRRDRRLQFR